MADALITLPKVESAVVPFDDEAFDKSTKTGDWLPRLQLMTSASEVCKSGEFPINHFALVRDQTNKDLGDSATILVIAWRPKAIEMGEEIISIYDPKDPEFERIQTKSGEKDSRCMYGPEFLVYNPEAESFATFFMGSKSMRREAPALRNLLQKAAVLKPHKIANAKYTWYSAKVEPCTTLFDLPDSDEIEEQYNKFINPPKKTVERVTEDEKSARAR